MQDTIWAGEEISVDFSKNKHFPEELKVKTVGIKAWDEYIPLLSDPRDCTKNSEISRSPWRHHASLCGALIKGTRSFYNQSVAK